MVVSSVRRATMLLVVVGWLPNCSWAYSIWKSLCIVKIVSAPHPRSVKAFTHLDLSAEHYSSTLSGKSFDCDDRHLQQQQLYLWEQQSTFTTINRLLNEVFSQPIQEPHHWKKPLLRRLDNQGEDSGQSSTRYCHFFSPLFKTTTHSIDDDDNMFPVCRDQSNEKIASFRLDIRYRGDYFCGWQRQSNSSLPSVQQVVEDWLQELQPSQDLQKRKHVDVRVCGRTDAGVNALLQICRFRTNDKGLSAQTIQRHLNQSPWQSSLQCIRVWKVSSKFHPTFGATCRAYAYLMDWNETFMCCSSVTVVERLNVLLKPLQRQELDYYSMSYGPVTTQTTCCTILQARVGRVEFVEPSNSNQPQHPTPVVALLFEFVADRFLRRMVRILVATTLQRALQESFWKDGSSTMLDDPIIPTTTKQHVSPPLLDILQQQSRRASAKPAPSKGLLLMGAAFERES